LFIHDCDLHEIRVVYDHTRIASYRHLRVGNVGGEYGYWLLEGNECSAAGGFPSNPILSGSGPNKRNVLLLEVSTLQGPELHLDVSVLQRSVLLLEVSATGPELHLDVSAQQRHVLLMEVSATEA
jgi:hypothetical protein